MVLMHHELGVTNKDGSTSKHFGTLLAYGEPLGRGPSAMATTVGLPAAIGAALILSGKVSQKGVILPVNKEIYDPILNELERLGIRMQEKIEREN